MNARAPAPSPSARPTGDRPAAARGVLRRLRRSEGGATTAEFSLLLIPFLFVMFAIIEVAFLFLADLSLDAAVGDVGRQVQTGQIDTSQITKDEFHDLVCNRLTALLKCSKVQVDLRTFPTYGEVTPTRPKAEEMQVGATGPDQIMALRAYYDWPLLSGYVFRIIGGTGVRSLAGVAAFRTEGY